MKPSQIWWSRIGRPSRFIEQIAARCQEGSSTLLVFPKGIPWEASFRETAQNAITQLHSQRMLRKLDISDEPWMEPEWYLLGRCCSSQIRSEYWPSMPVEQYLCRHPDITFHHCIYWVTGLKSASSRHAWEKFVLSYKKEAERAGLAMSSIFLIEAPPEEAVSCEADPSPLLPVLRCEIKPGDCRVFCMEYLSEYAPGKEDMTDYLTELAIRISPDWPELCSQLLDKPDDFLKNPVLRASRLLESPDGGRSQWAIDDLNHAVWNAQMVFVFPLLEEIRQNFVRSNASSLKYCLPLPNGNDGMISDPADLEFGNLDYIHKKHLVPFSFEEVNTINLCRRVRNRLAHNKLLSYEDIKACLALYLKY